MFESTVVVNKLTYLRSSIINLEKNITSYTKMKEIFGGKFLFLFFIYFLFIFKNNNNKKKELMIGSNFLFCFFPRTL